MINVMADLIGRDDTFGGARLNDPETWDRLMEALFKRMDEIEDERIREPLNSIDTEDFQFWIDDPEFWSAIEGEVTRRINVVKTLLPSSNEGHC